MAHREPIAKYYKPISGFIDAADPVWKAWRKMKEHQVKRLPVVKNNKIVGVVSDRDIVQISGYNGGQSMPVKEAMSLNPLILPIQTTIADALKSMILKEQHFAVVVDENSEPCGLFAWDSAIHFFLDLTRLSQLKQAGSN